MKCIEEATFVNAFPSEWSRRERELQKAEILSHAARISHQRRSLRRASSDPVPDGTQARMQKQLRFLLQCSDHALRQSKFMHEFRIEKSPAESLAKSNLTDSDEVNQLQETSLNRTSRSRVKQSDRRQSNSSHCRLEIFECASTCAFPQHFGCYRGELFSCIPNGHRQEVRTIVDFCLAAVHPPQDLLAEVFDVQNIYHKYVPFLSNQVFHHAGLGVVGLYLERTLDKNAKPSSELLMHQGQALAAVREGLEHFKASGRLSIPEGLITAIVFLAIFEGFSGNFKVVRHHLQGLKKVIDAVGGFRNLPKDDFFIEATMVLQFESLFVFAGLESILKNERRPWRQVYVRPPFSQQTLELLDQLPHGFRSLVRDGRLTEDTVSILSRAVKHNITNGTTGQARERASRRLGTRTYADLISACPLFAVPDSMDCLFEKLLCQTIKIFCGIAIDDLRTRTLSFTSTLLYLSSKIPVLHPDALSQRRCLLWMYMVAIDAHRSGFERGFLGPTGMSLLARVTMRLSDFFVETWDDVEEFLNLFFWTEGLSRFWRRKWNDLKKQAQSHWLSTTS